MLISVTKQDIKKGDNAFDACPLTIALRRYFGDKVSVSRDYIRVPKKYSRKKSKNKWLFIKLPEKAQNFILNYNSMYAVMPISFKISIKNVKLLKDNV